MAKLGEHGHEAVPAAPNTGVNTLTGEGLAEVLEGAAVVVDVSNPRRSPVLDAALRAQVAAAPDHLVVDLTGVRFLNYHAVVSLASVHRAASRAGIAFHLIGTDTPAVHRPLRIAGVLGHLDKHRRPSLAYVLADVDAGPHSAGCP